MYDIKIAPFTGRGGISLIKFIFTKDGNTEDVINKWFYDLLFYFIDI